MRNKEVDATILALQRYSSCIEDLDPEENATYNLGHWATLKDVVTAAFDKKKSKDCGWILSKLASGVVKRVEAVFKNPQPEAEEFLHSVSYLVEIASALDASGIKIDNLDKAIATVTSAYNKDEGSGLWKRLKPSVIAFYRGKKTEEVKIEPRLNQYARDDGVVSALSYELARGSSDSVVGACSLSERLVKELDSPSSSFEPAEDEVVEDSAAEVIIEKFCTIFAKSFDGRSVEYQNSILRLLRLFVKRLTSSGKAKVVEKFYQQHLDGIFNVEKILKNYQQQLTTAVNLIGDHQLMNSDVKKFEEAKESVSWFLLISPKDTVTRVCNHCLDNRGYTPVVVKIFYTMSPLFRLKSISTSPLLGQVLESVYNDNQARWENPEQLGNFFYFASSLTRKRRSPQDKEILEDELLSSNWLLNRLILPIIFLKDVPEHYQETVLTTLVRLLASHGQKEITFKWATRKGENFMETGYVPTPELIFLLKDLYFVHLSGGSEISETVKTILRNLGRKLAEEEVIFDKLTRVELLRGLNDKPWWFKYAISLWFQSSLGAPTCQIPSGLYKVLPSRLHHRYEEIHTDFVSSAMECFLKSIFELAFFDSELALAQLEHGIYKNPDDDHLSTKLALSIFDVYTEAEAVPKTISLCEVLKKLLTKVHLPLPTGKIDHLGETQYQSIKNTEYLSILAETAKIAYLQKSEKFDLVLDVFCEAVKNHVDSGSEKVREARKKLKWMDFDDKELEEAQLAVETMEKVLMFEVVHLFKDSCFFTKLNEKSLSTKLRVLLVTLIDTQLELQKTLANGYLDDVPTAAAKTDTFYAYANGTNDGNAAEVKSTATTSNFVENRLFSTSEVNGVVSQIGNASLKSQIETRLSGSSTTTKPDFKANAAYQKSKKNANSKKQQNR